MKIFWSWQSDNHQPSGRYFVRDVLGQLAAELSRELETEDAERPESDSALIGVDHDTLGVGGSPPIADTILRKIREAAVFVADVTPVGRTAAGKRLPNPNVMIELGYALKVLQHERIVLIMNQAEDAALKYLPFDLRHWRAPVTYSLRRDATDEHKAEVATALKDGLRSPIIHSLKAAARDWQEERRRTHREPKIRLVLDPADAGPWRLTQTVGDLGVKTLEEIKAETPLLPFPPASRVLGASLSPSMSRSLSGLRYGKPVSLWSREEIESYNRFLEQYYREYQRYLNTVLEYRRIVLRSFLVKFLVVNEGTAPATGIDVDITFPDSIVLYKEEEGLPEAPEAPEPPPLSPYKRLEGFVTPVSMNLPRLLTSSFVRSTTIYPKERRVHFRCDELKHHCQGNIEELIVTFKTASDIQNFEVDYVITANEPTEPIMGTVKFQCERLGD